jgi:hypothetical protein
MASKKVTVTFLNMSIDNNTGSVPDPVVPGPIEVFGRCDVGRMVDPFRGEVKTTAEEDWGRLVTVASWNLFDRSIADAVRIVEETPSTIESSTELEIPSGEFLQIRLHLAERDADGGGDDLLPGVQAWGEFAWKTVDVDMRTPFDQVLDDVLVLGPSLLVSGKRIKVKIAVTLARQG